MSGFGLGTESTRVRLWLVVMTAMVGLLGLQIARGPEMSTDILDLLPESEKDPVVAKALDQFTDKMAARHLFLVGANDPQTARTAAGRLASQLAESDLFRDVSGRFEGEQEAAFYKLYFPYRHFLLGTAARSAPATSAGAEAVVRSVEQKLYSPLSGMYSRLLEDDPLLLFPDFLSELPRPPGALKMRDGFLQAEQDGRVYILISAVSTGSVMGRESQRELQTFQDAATEPIRSDAALSLHQTGFVRYAARAAASAERETFTIGLGSFLGVVVLMLWVFRSARPLVLGVLPIVAGLIAATAVCFTVFGGLHMITLGFGAALIGVCIDYTFHYFCEALEAGAAGGEAVLKAIRPALLLGTVTSILGYLGLMIAPFPGLRQMALFSCVGLITATLTVICVFPAWSRHGGFRPQTALSIADGYMRLWERAPVWLLLVVYGVLGVVIGLGLYHLEADDDIRSLHKAERDLYEEELFIRRLAGNVDGGRFLLIEGATVEEVLQREEAIRPGLEAMVQSGELGFYQALSQFLPSSQRQIRSNTGLRELIAQPAMATDLADLGYEDALLEELRATLVSGEAAPLTLPVWLDHPASTHLRHLWLGETERGVASLMVLGGVQRVEPLRALEVDGVRYVDKVGSLSDLMSRYRRLAAALAVASYVVILLLVLWRYGFRRGLMVVLSPVTAALLALAVFGLTGRAVNLFNVLSLLLVLGIGIDYTIFFAEAEKRSNTTMLAVGMSACTTLLSFGLLALSATPVLSSFGATVLVGIAASMLLSPAVCRFSEKK